jgi:hypothetical protein
LFNAQLNHAAEEESHTRIRCVRCRRHRPQIDRGGGAAERALRKGRWDLAGPDPPCACLRLPALACACLRLLACLPSFLLAFLPASWQV